MSSLEKQMKQEIKKANFNIFEIAGFKVDPTLSLLAGMALGYKMALDHFNPVVEEGKRLVVKTRL